MKWSEDLQFWFFMVAMDPAGETLLPVADLFSIHFLDNGSLHRSLPNIVVPRKLTKYNLSSDYLVLGSVCS
jgi:hypothetical protein